MNNAVVLFDEDCGFCRWAAERLRRWDRRAVLTFRTIQDAEADGSLDSMDPGERYASWHVVGSDGRIWSGGAAIPRVMRQLPGGAPIAALTDAFPSATETGYRFLVRHRASLGTMLGEQACSIDPTVDVFSRAGSRPARRRPADRGPLRRRR
jgi:predicted DCC family thiol-disulfide oxidoreductase YuxK